MPRLLVALASALLVVGCTTGDGREAVSASVTLKKRPLPDGGIVEFVPLENQGTAFQMPATGGKLAVPRENGLKPGKYLVRVTAGDGKTAVNPVDPSQPPGPGGGTNIVSKDIIPADWGRNSKQEVTVVAGGPNEFTFDIP